MTFVWAMPSEPTPAELAEREADLAAVHNLLDGLDEHGIYALGVILSALMADGGQMRAVHFHGQVTAIKRAKFGLCHCGSFHKATEHGAAKAKHEEINAKSEEDNTAAMVAYQVHQCGFCSEFHCATEGCKTSWRTLDERMLYNQCPSCGAGPEVNDGK